MDEEEYGERVAADPVYRNSSQRWRDQLDVYPDVDQTTIDNCLWLERRASEDEAR